MKIIIEGHVRLISESSADSTTLECLVDKYTINGVEGPFSMSTHEEDTLEWQFPWGVLDELANEGYSAHEYRCHGRSLSLGRSLFTPRMGQEDTISSAVRTMQEFNSAMVIAGCGQGKTIIGSEAALRLGRSTCVLVHKEFLVDQWEEAFEMLCPGIRIGRLQRDTCDTGLTHDVVLAMTQSVTNPKREYPPEFYRSFGFLIGDEVHRYAAEVWQKSVVKFPAAHRLGLTATPYRSDRLWPVLEQHFGEHRVVLVGERLVPLIYPVRTTAKSTLGLENKHWLNNNQKRAMALSELSENDSRNEVIARNIRKAFAAGRKILVISERRKQLDWFGEWMQINGIRDVGYYVGGRKMPALEEASTKSIIFTTYQMAKEGLNIPDLDVLVMATPQAHIEQTVGRILRIQEGKGRPTVLDFVDESIPTFRGLWYARLKEYKAFNYEIAT